MKPDRKGSREKIDATTHLLPIKKRFAVKLSHQTLLLRAEHEKMNFVRSKPKIASQTQAPDHQSVGKQLFDSVM
jgi:hypothetical protein